MEGRNKHTKIISVINAMKKIKHGGTTLEKIALCGVSG